MTDALHLTVTEQVEVVKLSINEGGASEGVNLSITENTEVVTLQIDEVTSSGGTSEITAPSDILSAIAALDANIS